MKKIYSIKGACFFCAAFFFGMSTMAVAQVTADDSRPFGQGQIIDLPGTTDYLGDIPHEITVFNDPLPYHTVSGLSEEKVGWMDSNPKFEFGPNKAPAGVFFEDIPYPFASTAILNWMPVAGSFELLDFPAQAWWGPSASLGAIQLLAPALRDKPGFSGSLWGGGGGFGGGIGNYQDQTFSIGGNYQHGVMSDLNSFDTFSLLSKMNWATSDSFKLESGFLGSQWLSNDSWYSFFTSMKWDGSNFQSLQIKPFFQFAKWGIQDVQEIGAHVQYQFNMAGLIESHLMAGWSRDYFAPSMYSEDLSREFVQNTETFDVLGFINGDMAFRWDFSNASATLFSTLLGMQGDLGDWLLLGDFGKGTDATSLQNTQQVDLGIRYQPDDVWNLGCGYVHEQMGTVLWDGGRAKIQINHDLRILGMIKRLKLEITEQSLLEQGGPWINDVGGELRLGFFQRVDFWVMGRGVSNQPFYGETGVNYSVQDDLRVFLSVANLNDPPVSWPDPIALEGRIFWFGIESKSL